MAEIEDQFRTNVMQFIETVTKKLDGIATDVRTNTYKLDSVESQLGRLEAEITEVKIDVKEIKTDLRTLSGQFNDVGSMAIKDHTRLDEFEQRVDSLEQNPH